MIGIIEWLKYFINISSYPILTLTMQIGHFEITTNTNYDKRIRFFRYLGILYIIDML